MAQLNPDKLKENLAKFAIETIEKQQQIVFTGLFDLQADMLQRIFVNGLDNGGSDIGKYSTKPMYASPSSFTSQVRKSGIKPKGKNGSSKDFANGKQRKSQYLPGGYSELRAVLGRQNSKVDLNLSGALFNSIKVGVSGELTIGFNNDNEFEKAKGNEARFNKVIFAASEKELDSLVEKWEKATTELFFKSFE